MKDQFSQFICKDPDGPAGSLRLVCVGSMPDGAEVPTEFQVFPYGEIEIKGDEPFRVDEAAMDAAIRAFEARGLDAVIDYEHQTEGGEFASPDGTAPAAGWVKGLINKGTDGLWAVVEWTERARELLSRREYRYFSPVFYVSKTERRLVELARIALTNAPRLNWIRPIVARDNGNQDNPNREEAMEFLKKIAKLLGLAENATEEQVMAALSSLQEAQKPVIAKDVIVALGLSESATQSEVVASIHALKQRPDLTAEVVLLKRRLAERDRDDLVESALKSGKITAAQREWADAYALRDPEGFRLFVAKAPTVVPLDDLKILEDAKQKGSTDDVQLQINKMMGIDDSTWEKYGPKKA